MTSKTTMRAWIQSSAGHPSEVLSLKNLPVPIIKSPDEILIRVSRAALQPGAAIIMQICPFIFRSKPAIPETDFSGTIVSVGKNVTASQSLSAGMHVFGSIPLGRHIRAGCGALAEFIVVDASTVVCKPDEASFEMCSGLPVSGCTALALIRAAQLKPGDNVLINGASGGIGHLVLQMAKNEVGKSGKVVAICSGKNFEMVKGLGADEAIDYHTTDPVHQYLSEHYSDQKFDIIIDAFGNQELYFNCSGYLAKGKPFVTVGVAAKEYTVSGILYASFAMIKNMVWPQFLGGGERPYFQVAAVTTRKGLEELAQLVREGKLKVAIDSCSGMEDVLSAYAVMLVKRARGKIIIKVGD